MRNQIIFRSKITKHIRWKKWQQYGKLPGYFSLVTGANVGSWSQSCALWHSSSVELHSSVAVFWKLFSPAYLYGNYDSQFSTAILCDGNRWFEFILSLNAEDQKISTHFLQQQLCLNTWSVFVWRVDAARALSCSYAAAATHITQLVMWRLFATPDCHTW